MATVAAVGQHPTDHPSIVVTRDVRDHVAHIVIDRPDRRNALRLQDKMLLADAVGTVAAEKGTHAIVVSGASTDAGLGAFCAGTDVKEMGSLDSDAALEMYAAEERLYRSLMEAPITVILAIEGAAIGAGCVLSCCADVVIAGESAVFQTPEVRLGLPAPLQTAMLQQVVGLAWARRMLLTCEAVRAPQAAAIGLTTEVVADGHALARAIEVAERVAEFPPFGIRAQKSLLRAWASGEVRTAVDLSPYVAALALSRAGGCLPDPHRSF